MKLKISKYCLFYSMIGSGSSVVVEHSPHQPKVEGSGPATAMAEDGRKWQLVNILIVFVANIIILFKLDRLIY